jgi:hypothetical protein
VHNGWIELCRKLLITVEEENEEEDKGRERG